MKYDLWTGQLESIILQSPAGTSSIFGAWQLRVGPSREIGLLGQKVDYLTEAGPGQRRTNKKQSMSQKTYEPPRQKRSSKLGAFEPSPGFEFDVFKPSTKRAANLVANEPASRADTIASSVDRPTNLARTETQNRPKAIATSVGCNRKCFKVTTKNSRKLNKNQNIWRFN